MQQHSPKTVGILTLFYQNYNFGAILQAYALYHYLSKQSYVCEEINFLSDEAAARFKRNSRLQGLLHPVSYVFDRIKTCQARKEYFMRDFSRTQIEAFDAFIRREFSSTQVYGDKSIYDLAERYDWNLVGGDQVWNPTWSAKAYFLEYVRRGQKIAYSCSIGNDILTKRETDWIISHAKNLDSVSVREADSAELLRNRGLPCAHVPDPVFLLSSDEWRDFARQEQPLIEKPYCFSYLLGLDAEPRKRIRDFADRNHVALVSIPHIRFALNKNDIGYADIDITTAGPREFVNLIANAEYVFTDSFHGSAFSLLLGKRFRSLDRSFFGKNSQLSRLLSLLRDYSMEKRLISIDAVPETKFAPSESEYSPLLAAQIERSRLAGQSYLREAMK